MRNKRIRNRRPNPFTRFLFTLTCCKAPHSAISTFFIVVKLHYYFTSIPPTGVPIIVSYTCASLWQSLNCGFCISSIYRHGELPATRSFILEYIISQYCLQNLFRKSFQRQHLPYPYVRTIVLIYYNTTF